MNYLIKIMVIIFVLPLGLNAMEINETKKIYDPFEEPSKFLEMNPQDFKEYKEYYNFKKYMGTFNEGKVYKSELWEFAVYPMSNYNKVVYVFSKKDSSLIHSIARLVIETIMYNRVEFIVDLNRTIPKIQRCMSDSVASVPRHLKKKELVRRGSMPTIGVTNILYKYNLIDIEKDKALSNMIMQKHLYNENN